MPSLVSQHCLRVSPLIFLPHKSQSGSCHNTDLVRTGGSLLLSGSRPQTLHSPQGPSGTTPTHPIALHSSLRGPISISSNTSGSFLPQSLCICCSLSLLPLLPSSSELLPIHPLDLISEVTSSGRACMTPESRSNSTVNPLKERVSFLQEAVQLVISSLVHAII